MNTPPGATLLVRDCGTVDYAAAWQAMRDFTDARGPATPDECWLVQHPPVYTLGLAGRTEHLIAPGAIPVVRTDRGGQVTYHGPGQVLCYLLCDLTRAGIGVRALVTHLEQAALDLLADLGIAGQRRPGAPGVYVGAAKIAALGLRVRRGCCYHGLALNVDMDLAPFGGINPCGYAGLAVTQLRALCTPVPPLHATALALAGHVARQLGRTLIHAPTGPATPPPRAPG